MSLNMNTTKGLMIGVLAGGTIGTIVALLTAPKSGKELRGDIKQKSGEYLNEAEKFYTDTKNKANDIINSGKKKYASLVHDVKEKPDGILKDAEQFFTETKANTKNALQTSKEKLEVESEHLKSSIAAGNETYKRY